jgi:biopolymer transport protein ExbD
MRIRNKPRATGEIKDSSMSDIAFLLLIFFLVTTTFEVQKGISYKLPKKPDPDTPEVVIDETNRLVMTIKQWGLDEYVALIDQAPEGGPLQRASAGEDVSLEDTVLTNGIMSLAAERAEAMSIVRHRLLNNLEVAKGVPSGTFSSLESAIQAENLYPMVRPGILREAMGDATPLERDPTFGDVAFGDTLVLADQRQGDIASVVRESELVVILKFFPDCDYDGMITALDMLRRSGVSRTGITIQERLGGDAS